MTIDPTTSAAATTGATAAPATTTKGTFGDVSSNQFLKLLVAQLQNQNPLSPQDGSAFVAQLAQFSSLEQMTNISSGVDTLSKSQSWQTAPGLRSLCC